MKKILFLFICCFLFVQCIKVNGQTKNDWIKENLNGKVKSIKEINYQAIYKFGEVKQGGLEDSVLSEYDSNGHFIEVIKYPYNGNIDKIIYKYDNKGIKIEENECCIDYGNEETFIFKHDIKGNIIEKNEYKFDGSFKIRFTYKYDNKGNLTEENGCLTVHKYDSEGNTIIEDEHFAGGENFKYTYKYDNKGNIIEKSKYKYEPDETYAFINSIKLDCTYKYDNKGNQIEYNEYKLDGSLDWKNIYKYEFDKKDNWIHCILYRDEMQITISERVIVYY